MACLQPHRLQPSAGEGSSRQPGEERSGAGSLSLGTLSLPGFSSLLVRARNLPMAPELPRQKSPEL